MSYASFIKYFFVTKTTYLNYKTLTQLFRHNLKYWVNLYIMTDQLVELNVTGMHCNNCAISIHRLLENKGLHNILVDFAGEEVKFSTADQTLVPGIIKDIEGLGFR